MTMTPDAARAERTTAALTQLLTRVAADWGVRNVDVLGSSRGARAVADVRQIVMWAGYQAGFTQQEIATYLGRDHSTVNHGIQNIAARGKLDPALRQYLLTLPLPEVSLSEATAETVEALRVRAARLRGTSDTALQVAASLTALADQLEAVVS